MSRRATELTDDEVRARIAELFGEQPEQLAGVPAAELRAMLGDVEQQLDDYVALGLLTPEEAAAKGGWAAEPDR